MDNRRFGVLVLWVVLLCQSGAVGANDRIELEITTIHGNKELPRMIYVVPWKDIKQKTRNEYKMILHSLFGDLFDPVLPEQKARTAGATDSM